MTKNKLSGKKRDRKPVVYKPKKCKFSECENTFTPRVSLQVVCSTNCAIGYAKEKKRKEHKAETRRMRREMNQKSRSWHLEQAQRAFNAYIRERDKGRACISCGTQKPGIKYEAGHYRTVGAQPSLRFNEDNCHLQCAFNCNHHRSGNVVDYRIGLVERIGVERVEALEKDQPAANWTIEDIEAIKKKYLEKKRLLIEARKGE